MKTARWIIAIVCTVGMFYSCYRLVMTEVRYSKAEIAYEKISESYVAANTPVPQTIDMPKETSVPAEQTEGEEESSQIPADVDFDGAMREYSELHAWIYSEGTPINYPVMQGTDDEYYLEHLPSGEYSIAGSLFIGASLPNDFSARNTVIYGHNMNNESMFGSLRNYREQSYYDAHPYMYLITPDGEYRLDVLAGFDATLYSDVYQQINEWDDLSSYILSWKQNSEFVSAAGEDYDKVVVLSTCSTQENLRFVVVCGMVRL